MPRKSNARAPQGSGTIRQRKDGTWEARYTVGRDPGTGKQKQKSIYGKTEAEVAQKLRQITHELDKGSFLEPSKMRLGQWLDIWLKEYCGNIKPNTMASYETQVRVHIKPALGAVKLSELQPHQIQTFYNRINLSSKTVRNIHGILHRALDQALKLNYIRANPCSLVIAPRLQQVEMRPLDSAEMGAFLGVLKDSDYLTICKVTMFTGMRESEIMGLTWDRVDFTNGTIYVDRQLMRLKQKGGIYKFAPPKNNRPRKLTPAPTVMAILKARKKEQTAQRLAAGNQWNEGDFPGLVFTNPFGGHYVHTTLNYVVHRAGEKIGIDRLRFHDLRHTYAVAAIRAGDDVKTVSANLGHATVAFTLDKYAHYTQDMRKESADRMEAFMAGIENV